MPSSRDRDRGSGRSKSGGRSGSSGSKRPRGDKDRSGGGGPGSLAGPGSMGMGGGPGPLGAGGPMPGGLPPDFYEHQEDDCCACLDVNSGVSQMYIAAFIALFLAVCGGVAAAAVGSKFSFFVCAGVTFFCV